MRKDTPALSVVPTEEVEAAQLRRFLADFSGHPQHAGTESQPFAGRGFAALAEGDVVALMAVKALRSLVPGETLGLAVGSVKPAFRRRGLGSHLLQRTLEELRRDSQRLAVSALIAPEHAEPGGAFLAQAGFHEIPGVQRFEAPLGAPPAEEAATGGMPRFRVRPYRGGEPAVNEAAADLYRRAYRGQPAIPDLTAAEVEVHLGFPSFLYLLLEEGERLIGFAAIIFDGEECYVSSNLVARTHWGTGGAEFLLRALQRFAAAQGCTCISGSVSAANRAGAALIERAVPSARLTSIMRRFMRLFENEAAQGSAAIRS